MNDNRLLVGEVVDYDRVPELEQAIRELRQELKDARAEAHRAGSESARSVSALRRQLTPLYRALQGVFGEMDAIGMDDSAEAPSGRSVAVWESWKQRLGGGAAKCIDALLLHREMNTQQLAIATGLHRTTIPKLIYQLNKAGLISKNGGRFSLKSLA